MVAKEAEIHIPQEEIFLVSQRKYNLDPDRPLWQKLFFRWVYLPVVRFAFNYANISAPAAKEPDGSIVMIEQVGAYVDEQTAEERCREGGGYWSVKPFPLNYDLPAASVRYPGHRYPGSVMPDRFRRKPPQAQAVFPHQIAALRNSLATASKTLDGTVDGK